MYELRETNIPAKIIRNVPKGNEFSFTSTPCEEYWGEFDVPMTIYFKPETGIKDPLTIDHRIKLDEEGNWKTIEVPMCAPQL